MKERTYKIMISTCYNGESYIDYCRGISPDDLRSIMQKLLRDIDFVKLKIEEE